MKEKTMNRKTFKRLSIVIVISEGMVIIINMMHFSVFNLNHANACLNIDLRERIFRKVPMSLSLYLVRTGLAGESAASGEQRLP